MRKARYMGVSSFSLNAANGSFSQIPGSFEQPADRKIFFGAGPRKKFFYMGLWQPWEGRGLDVCEIDENGRIFPSAFYPGDVGEAVFVTP